jgi:hypothetical protein
MRSPTSSTVGDDTRNEARSFSGRAVTPRNLTELLAAVVPGRVVYLGLTGGQRRELRDRDGQIALDVLRHLLGARADLKHPDAFPLTEGAFQAVARKLSHEVGQKRARRLIARLRAERVIIRAGSYRQAYRNLGVRSGFRVALHRLTAPLRLPRVGRTLGTARAVKRHQRRQERRGWWEQPLFGDISGRPPPEIPPWRARRMRSLDEVL